MIKPFQKSVLLTALVIVPMLLTNTIFSAIQTTQGSNGLLAAGFIWVSSIIYLLSAKPKM